MLTESLVTAIMGVSLTGAGLVLAVLALIAPFSRRVNFMQISEKNKPRFKKLLLGVTGGLVVTFYLYILSTLMAYGWLSEPSNNTAYGILLQAFFLIGNVMFLVFGGFVAELIFVSMQKDLARQYP
jgi:hypothetical protein